jgi:hypothetical protein
MLLFDVEPNPSSTLVAPVDCGLETTDFADSDTSRQVEDAPSAFLISFIPTTAMFRQNMNAKKLATERKR